MRLKMHDHVLNSPVTCQKGGFDTMSDAMPFFDRRERIYLYVKLDQKFCPAFSDKTLLDFSDSGLRRRCGTD